MSKRSLMNQIGDDPSSNVQAIASPSKSDPTSSSSSHVVYNIGGVNVPLSSVIGDLRSYAQFNEWHRAKRIYYDHYPDLVRIPLTANKDTALHVAVSGGNADFVRAFVNYEHVTPKDLEIPNGDGKTAFCLAAMAGERELLETMIKKNQELPFIRTHDEMLPIHWTLSSGFHQILQTNSLDSEILFSQSLVRRMDFKDTQRLFLMAINNNIYDVANYLCFDLKLIMSNARDDEGKTALHMLAVKPNFGPRQIIQHLWWEGGEFCKQDMRIELITTPSILLFDAIKSGNLGFLEAVLDMDPKPWELKDPKTGQTILHTAVLFRHRRILDLILQKKDQYSILRQAVDKDLNNALHYAASQIQEASTNLRPDIQIQKEVAWFQEMERRLGSELSTMTNKDNKTPKDIFHVNHRKLSNDAKETAKGVANTCMVVAALVVTVAFAAALTTPGGKNNAWFVIFMMANAAAIFTSALSIVAFLTIFTSSTFQDNDFVTSLYPSLNIGKMLLFVSLITMIIAFVAASFLIFGEKRNWAAYVVTLFGVLTINYILQLQLSLFTHFIGYFSSRYIKPCLKFIKFPTKGRTDYLPISTSEKL